MGDAFSDRKSRKRGKNKGQETPTTTSKTKVTVTSKSRFSGFWENPEVAISNMASSMNVKKLGAAIPEYFLGKFAYVQAFTLIMLMAERALKIEKSPPMHPYIIYTVAGLCFLSGVMLSAKIKVQAATLLYSLVLVYLTFNAYTNKKFNYSRHERNRISGRHLGCLGIYLVYAFIKSSRQSKLLQRAGELCIALYLLGTAYIINESYEDRRAVLEFIPGGNYGRYFVTLIYGSAGLCFLSGYFLKDIALSVSFCLIFMTCLVDIRFYYWTYRGMAYWNQLRLVVDNVNLIVGFFLLSNFYENVAEDETEGDDDSSDDSDDDSRVKSE